MNRYIRYQHQLSQLSVEIRNAADDLEAFQLRLEKDKIAKVPLPELQAKWLVYVACHHTAEVIDPLRSLADTIQADEEISTDQLTQDMLMANQHALRLCSAVLATSKLLI